MPQISLTDFVDIVSASGTPKATKVRQVKRRPAYAPAADFYKPLRERIVEAHRFDYGRDYIDGAMADLTDQKKMKVYPPIVDGYKKWWGKKTLVWFDAPSFWYSKHGVDVAVNPELGLKINETPHLVKLYFKSDPLAKNKVDIITNLMAIVSSQDDPDPVMSVLDIRRGKLFSPTVSIPGLTAMLDAELAYISALWPSL
jgi:hypothetical protein